MTLLDAMIEGQEFSSVRPLLDWLDCNGFTVVTKPTKEFIDANGYRNVKGDMDIELTVDAMEPADRVDHIVLFSGDGDFRSLVEAVQRRGVRVTVVSKVSSRPPMIADERTSPPGGRVHRSDGFAIQNRLLSARALNSEAFSRPQFLSGNAVHLHRRDNLSVVPGCQSAFQF
jgi:NYN domain